MGSWIVRILLSALLVAAALILVPRWWYGDSQQGAVLAIRDALKAHGLEQISVLTDGDRVKVSGEVPVREFRNEAVDIARRYVADKVLEETITVAKPVSPYGFSAHLNDGKLTIQGYVGTRRQQQQLTQWLGHQHADGSNAVRLRYAEGTPLHWGGTVKTALTGLLQLQGGDLQIRYHGVKLSGQAESEDVLKTLQKIFLPLQAIDYAIDTAQVSVALSCIEKVHVLAVASPLRFARGADRIAPESKQFLDDLAAIAQTCPDVSFVVNGYTDNRGNARKNLRLSQARAEAVVRAMAERGIPPGRFTAVGHGAASPVADNSKASGRSRNRRIEFNVKNPSE